MRIAVASWSNRRFGGTGTYLTDLFDSLRELGHATSLIHERDAPLDHPPLELAPGTPTWNIQTLGVDRAVAELRAWKPDVLYAHGFLDPGHEEPTLGVAPAVFFAHDYYGTCISGFKAHRNPVVQPCDRVLGWQCLAQYYPRRCGGWSPVTMVREFRRQSSRLDLLRRYHTIATHSDRMREEYLRHGFEPSRVTKVAHGVRTRQVPASPASQRPRGANEPWRLLFVGRMYEIKGGRELIQALPMVARALDRPVHLTCAGEGAQRGEWERQASAVCAGEPRVRVQFTGWLAPDNLGRTYDDSDLVVMPSLWPEPFGLVGAEAGAHGVPVAAFDVGGIPEWLQHGINGHLASGDPPTIEGLADAIVASLKDIRVHARLCEGARQLAATLTFDRHVAAILEIFESARASAREAA